jgi:hypothetical protein
VGHQIFPCSRELLEMVFLTKPHKFDLGGVYGALLEMF